MGLSDADGTGEDRRYGYQYAERLYGGILLAPYFVLRSANGYLKVWQDAHVEEHC